MPIQLEGGNMQLVSLTSLVQVLHFLVRPATEGRDRTGQQ